MHLAQFGLSELTKQQKNKDKPEDKSDDPMIRIEKLESQIKDKEKQDKLKDQQQSMLSAINTSAEKFNYTKNGSRRADKIKIITLARLQHNPRLNPAEVFAEEVKDFMEIDSEAKTAREKTDMQNAKVAAAVSGVVTDSGGMPILDTAKEFKAEDLRTNVSREALHKYLEGRT